MRVYLGQTRSSRLIPRLNGMGFGELTQPSEVPPRRRPWAFDNSAYRCYQRGIPFDSTAYNAAVGLHRPEQRPDFIVVPDIVAGGVESLRFSLSHLFGLRFAPCYLVVQDGMDDVDVARAIDPYDGLFVGGTTHWKRRTAPAWVRLAHRFGRPCHVGRIGSLSGARWARDIGADSIDSNAPLYSDGNLDRLLRGLADPQKEFPL